MIFFKLIIQEAQAAGCFSSDEANRYLEQKGKRDAEESPSNAKENIQAGASGQGGVNMPTSFDSVCRDSNSRTLANLSSFTDLDTGAFPGADLLSESVSLQFLFPNFL